MNRNVRTVLIAQFLTAFADNAILFTAITMVLMAADPANWYVPALQGSFLVAFVLLAPWVGRFSDSRPKASVLTMANIVKALGASMMFFGVEPLISYAIVGLGAALYSPAKYGILPELVEEDQLVKANGWIEGSTILAILSGMLVGAWLSEASISLALAVVVALYIVSALVALFIERLPVVARDTHGPVLPHFVNQIRRLFSTPRARFSTLGVSLFWAVSAVLRVLVVAWAPAVLLITQTSDIAELTMFLAFGVAIGAVVAPRVIPLAALRRARLAAYFMGVFVLTLSLVDTVWLARLVLLLCGIAGGMFIVPINAALQEIGHKSIGSGGAVAVQNFFENVAMLIASGLYAVASGLGAMPVTTIVVLGVSVLVLTSIVSWHLPPDTKPLDTSI